MIAATKLSEDQQAAVDNVRAWMNGRHGRELSLGGYAGTGKTTIIQHLWPELRKRGCQVVTPTGKAGQVLRSKGIDRACTIHSLIYHFRGVVETDEGAEQPVFDDRAQGDWGVKDEPNLLVCDEASMVNERLYGDLMERGLPVLWVGDHGQLPPVGGDPGVMDSPAIRLERIHRQAASNPLLQLAHHVRAGNDVSREYADGGQLKIGGIRDNWRIVEYASANDIDQVIVGTNRVRNTLNDITRKHRKYEGLLVEGERLICTFNNRRRGLWNGQIFRVSKIVDEFETYYECDLETETASGWEGRWHGIKIQKLALGNPDYRSTDRLRGCDEFDYGYAVTCHKSQGSEWSRVLVVDQNVSQFDMDRWRYTAFTRAKEHLSVVLR